MKKAALAALLAAASMHAVVRATDPPKPGPNNNVVSGVLTTIPPPTDQAGQNLAAIKTDLLLQRQNEPVIAASTRNPDHLIAAANDYRTVAIAGDFGVGESTSSFVARLIARVFHRARPNLVEEEADAAEAWMGIYRSCDRGRTWIGSMVPGSPNDVSTASVASPLKGYEAASDPVIASLPRGRVVVGGLVFTRNGPSAIFSTLYEDQNNHEGGACFSYVPNSTKIIATAANASNGAFADKPAMASDTRGGVDYVYMSYTVFDGLQNGRVRSHLMLARSADGGVTWTSAQPKVNKSFLRSQGSAIAIDPLTGDVYVVWRLFYDNVMMVVKSTDHGLNWSNPVNINYTPLAAFDQGTGGAPTYAFRSNAFPTITAAVVNGQTKLFAAWQERVGANGQPLTTGSPRIVVATSNDGGLSWTSRAAVDMASRTDTDVPDGSLPVPRPSGPQVMPSLTQSVGHVMLLYYEARRLGDVVNGQELGGPAPGYITGLDRQMDARVAEIDPVTGTLAATSVQVSQYSLDPTKAPPKLVETAPGYPAVNRPNLPMYRGGTVPFAGDYIFLAPAVPFVTGSPWHWPSADEVPGPSFHAVFNDNRLVGYPFNAALGAPAIDGDWTKYTPAGSPACVNPLSRNADIFHSEINGGLIAGSPQTFKSLGSAGATGLTMKRAFVAYAENQTGTSMFVRLTIIDSPPTVDASFLQFSDDNDVELEILPHSSVTRTVYAMSANPTASFRVNVDELNGGFGTGLKPGGRHAVVVFNGDATNPPLGTSPSVPQIDSNETHTPQIDSPQIDSKGPFNPQIDSPQIDSNAIKAPQIDSPQIDSPQIDSSQLSSSQLSASAIGGVDVVWNVDNVGNTTSVFNSFMNVPNADQLIASGWQFQVIIALASYAPGVANGCANAATVQTRVISNIPITTTANPQIDSPQIDSSNPQIDSPQIDSAQISNATFSLAPASGVEGESAFDSTVHSPVLRQRAVILLRAIQVSPSAQAFNPATVQLLVKAQAVNVIGGQAQGTETSSDFSGPLEITTAPQLPMATFDAAYITQFAARGGVKPYAWSVAGLPPGVTFNSATGVISGTAAQVGTFTVIATASDSSPLQQTANKVLSLTVGLPSNPHLAFTVSPGLTSQGKRLNAPPQVTATYTRPSDNHVVGIPGVSITLALGSGAGMLVGDTTLTTTGTGGTATFSNVWIDTATPSGAGAAGPHTLKASSAGFGDSASSTFTVGAKTILIYGRSLRQLAPTGYTGSWTSEDAVASLMNYNVTIKSASAWSSMVQADFASYNGVVFPDPTCNDENGNNNYTFDSTPLQTAEATGATWSPAITGPKLVAGTDPQWHSVYVGSRNAKTDAQQLMQNAITFSASAPDTGMYMALSCYYESSPASTAVAALSGFGAFTVQGFHGDTVTVNSSHGSMAKPNSVTDATLSTWGSSVHEWFNAFPAEWYVVARETSAGSKAYIISDRPQ